LKLKPQQVIQSIKRLRL